MEFLTPPAIRWRFGCFQLLALPLDIPQVRRFYKVSPTLPLYLYVRVSDAGFTLPGGLVSLDDLPVAQWLTPSSARFKLQQALPFSVLVFRSGVSLLGRCM